MDNIIYTSDDNAIGFYEDLKKAVLEGAKANLEQGDYEMVKSDCDDLMELEKYKDYEGLLFVSNNNGMGTTITKYKEGE